MQTKFRVGVTPEARRSDGFLLYDFSLLDEAPHIEWELLSSPTPELSAEVASQYDALMVPTSVFFVTPNTLNGDRLTLVARLGAGINSIDVEACTESGVVVTTAPDAVRRPMATAAIGFLLALSLKIMKKDRLTREGRWHEGVNYIGDGLVGRTLGVIGLGNIGREVLRLAAPLSMRHLAFDPYLTGRSGSMTRNIQLVGLDELLAQSDFICIACPLTKETYHLLNASKLSMMKPGSCLINIARGRIVEQPALVKLLVEGRIAGAALDVFEEEPIDPSDPLLSLDTVILTPHAIGWTDECGAGGGRNGSAAVLAVARGITPPFIINRAVLRDARLRSKLRNYRRQFGGITA